jgi:hypothetical protein
LLLLQDGASAHTTQATDRWLKEKKIQLFPHPANSSDLYLFLLIWGIMKSQLSQNSDLRYQRY